MLKSYNTDFRYLQLLSDSISVKEHIIIVGCDLEHISDKRLEEISK